MVAVEEDSRETIQAVLTIKGHDRIAMSEEGQTDDDGDNDETDKVLISVDHYFRYAFYHRTRNIERSQDVLCRTSF